MDGVRLPIGAYAVVLTLFFSFPRFSFLQFVVSFSFYLVKLEPGLGLTVSGSRLARGNTSLSLPPTRSWISNFEDVRIYRAQQVSRHDAPVVDGTPTDPMTLKFP